MKASSSQVGAIYETMASVNSLVVNYFLYPFYLFSCNSASLLNPYKRASE
ncbi:hypothetical protein BH09BAC4_BH09BAC4_04300 [soil metagenome]